MDVVERSRDQVEDLLAALEDEYESVPVQQTTASVPSDYYEQVCERYRDSAGRIDVQVTNDEEEVLVLETDDGDRLPSTHVSPGEAIDAAGRCAVETATDLACTIDALESVTIVGVHDESEADGTPVYCLVAVLTGTCVAGQPGSGARWVAEPPTSELLR